MSHNLKQRAFTVMPGGVNSPVRAFKSVGGTPLFAKSARGALLKTEEGTSYIDFCMSFGPLMLGHSPASVVRAIAATASKGTSFAMTTRREIELAELIRSAIPSMERVRLVSSGTEAVMTALRLARGFTGRSKILKFSGCYHGHADSMLVQAGSGVAGIASASSAGVPKAFARETLVAPYNDCEAVTRLIKRHGKDMAAIIVEPVAANMGLVLPQAGFLEHLRQQADACGALLIFDEVITGFRLTFGGYQKLCGVTPDLTTLGKIIGGGMPIGAVGGRAAIMESLAPLGPVYQAGTLSGNPVSVAAGLAMLKQLKKDKPYKALEQRTEAFVRHLFGVACELELPLQIPYFGSLFSFFFCEQDVWSFEDVQRCDARRFSILFKHLLREKVYLPPSPFEVSFLSTAHDERILKKAARAFERALIATAEEP